jgi:hypothetical protein
MIEVKLNLVDKDTSQVLEKYVTLSTKLLNAQEKEITLKDMVNEFSDWAKSYVLGETF